MKKILVLILFSFFRLLLSKDFIYPSEIKPGMTGYGKTVFKGTKIERFGVKVLGVLKNNKFSDKLVINGESILIKVSGNLIEEAGGIAAGMSGAPIYIKGRLLGALSAGWMLTDHKVGLVTPITEMLKLTQYPYMKRFVSREVELTEPIELNGKIYNKIKFIDPDENILDEKDVLSFVLAKTPMFISKGNKTEIIINNTKYKLNIPDINNKKNISIEPGTAIGVQIARGDINITTLGTLTYYDKNRNIIVAFGHPFLHKGSVDYFLSKAYIYYCFSSLDMPFKVGAPLDLIGSVVEDRGCGIVGIINRVPDYIPLKLYIRNEDFNLQNMLNIKIVSDYSVLSDVLNAISEQAINESIDYVGNITVRSFFNLYIDVNGKVKEFKYSNFYSGENINELIVQDLLNSISVLYENEFIPISIKQIYWNISTSTEQKTAKIVKVKLPEKELLHGEVIGINIYIKPYRKPEFIKTVFMKLPDNGDSYSIVIRGGYNYRNNMELKNEFDSFDNLFSYLSDIPQNSELLISLIKSEEKQDKEEINNVLVKKVSTNYVLDGYYEDVLVIGK